MQKDLTFFRKNIFHFLAVCVFGFILFAPGTAGADNKALSGFAWSENIGWIKFDHIFAGAPVFGGVYFDDTTGIFSGYAWSENIGWVSFADFDGDADIDANDKNIVGSPCVPNCEAKIDLGDYKVSGWARALAFGGGWDGWIKLRDTNYGIWLDTAVPPGSPAEFRDFAWGGDDNNNEAVIGWISFNCEDREAATGKSCKNAGDADFDPAIHLADYKVTVSFAPNRPPLKPTTSENFNNCSIQKLSIPTFNWTYYDPDNNSQLAYQIKIYGEANLDETVGLPVISYTPDYEWIRNNLNWGETYGWQVRVQDTGSAWSEWSDLDFFTMPVHAYPWVDFDWLPERPGVDELAAFIDKTECYDAGGSIVPCASWLWSFPDWRFEAGYNVSSQNPVGKFTSTGAKDVYLTTTDSTGYACEKKNTVNARLPLPEWKEIPPSGWVNKILAFLRRL